MIDLDDPRAAAFVGAIRRGELDELRRLLAEHPTLAAERFGDDAESRTALHLATDWPGHLPRVAETIAALVAAGAPLEGRFIGAHRETALHWAASADDVAAIDALVAAGADLEATGAVFTDGAPLSDAVVFGQWRAARRLVEHGASMTIWQAAAVGHADVLRRLLDDPAVSLQDVTNACWHARRAGQAEAARMLVGRGAELDRPGPDERTARQVGAVSGNAQLVAWLRQN